MVNSVSSMPILRITHSSASTTPVEKAMSGMSPLESPAGQLAFVSLHWGMFVSVAATGVLWHAGTFVIVTWRRHLPSWITSGMFAPTGTLPSEKVPLTAVTVLTSGEPETVLAQLSQETPGAKGCTGALGT